MASKLRGRVTVETEVLVKAACEGNKEGQAWVAPVAAGV